eukprot:SAG31_NODE_39373_length_288_cov_2.788360_1_plen_51_part_10
MANKKFDLIEHINIRGRARSLSVFVLADMWAKPMNIWITRAVLNLASNRST